MNLHSQDGSSPDAEDRRLRVPVRKSQLVHAPIKSGDGDEIDFATLLRVVSSRKGTVLACMAAFLLLAGVYAYTATPLYTATANLVITPKQQNLLNLQEVVPGLSTDFQTMNTEVLVLESRTLLGHVVDTLSLTKDPEFNPGLRPKPAWKDWTGYNYVENHISNLIDKTFGSGKKSGAPPATEGPRAVAVDILGQLLDVHLVSDTYAIEVSVAADSGPKAARIADKIAQLYITQQRDDKLVAGDHALVWLGKRVAELKNQLQASESKVRNYSAKSTVMTEQGLALEIEKLKRLKDELASKTDKATQLHARIDRLETLRAQDKFDELASFAVDSRLSSLAGQLAQGGNTALREQFSAVFEQRVRQLGADVDRVQRQIASLKDGITSLESDLQTNSSDFVKLNQLQRDAEANKLIYENTLARMKDISVQQGVQQADARILDAAKVPLAPSHPHKALALGAGGVFGALVGLFIAFLSQSLRSTIESSEQLEAATGLPVIGIIPEARSRRPDGPLRHIIQKPASPAAEAVRNLRTTLQLSNIDAPPQVIMTTSSVPGEGKSTLSAALAQTNAASGKRVLLIDADLRHRTLSQFFHSDKPVGLLSLLSGAASLDEAIVHDEPAQMDILFADEGSVTAGDIFGSRRFVSFLSDMRRVYDIIVIDTPPVLAVSDTRIVAQHADAIVYLVRWNATKLRMVRAGLEALRHVNVEVGGLVLNRMKASGSEQYGYYGGSYT